MDEITKRKISTGAIFVLISIAIILILTPEFEKLMRLNLLFIGGISTFLLSWFVLSELPVIVKLAPHFTSQFDNIKGFMTFTLNSMIFSWFASNLGEVLAKKRTDDAIKEEVRREIEEELRRQILAEMAQKSVK